MDKLDTNEATSDMWLIWRIVGFYPPKKFKWLYYFYAIIVNLAADIASPICAFINVFYLTDLALIMHNLQLSPTLIVATLKKMTIYFNMKDFFNVKTYLNQLDKRAARNEEEVVYLKNIIKQCHLIARIVQVALFCSLSSYTIPGIVKRKLVFEGWLPFDWKASTVLYVIAFISQFYGTGFLCIHNAASDGYPPIYINVLKGHIHALAMRVARIGKDPRMTSEENFNELKSCVHDHQIIIGLFDTIRRVISLTVMLQFIITAFVLCVAGVHFLIFDRGVSQLFSTLIYMAGVLSESFPVCYFANALQHETDGLTTAIYSCNWMDQSVKFRKNLIIFMQRSQQANIIVAGGLATISLQTLTGIIRFSFSLFSMLSQIQH